MAGLSRSRFLLPEFLGVDAVLGAASGILVTQERRPADEVDGQAIQIAENAIFPCILETHTGDGSQQVNTVRLVTELNHFSCECQIGGGYIEAAESELESARSTRSALAWLGQIRKSISAEYRGNPCHETASAPTTRYSTSFEFKHSTNSRKSLLNGIGVGSLSQFEEYAGPLLRGHLSAGKRVRGIGFLKGIENADYFLHNPILRWLFDCCCVVEGKEVWEENCSSYCSTGDKVLILKYP